MRFAMAYSCGKDSTLALHRLIKAGHEPVMLITMFREEQGRSWFHGADKGLLAAYERALGIPLRVFSAASGDYADVFETALKTTKTMGAEAAAFGDLDLDSNRRWEEERCASAGLAPIFPLWGLEREAVVREALALGYACVLKDVDTSKLPEHLLGRLLSPDLLEEIRATGADVCGENGEYHTLALAGPIFRQPIRYSLGPILRFGNHAAISLELAG